MSGGGDAPGARRPAEATAELARWPAELRALVTGEQVVVVTAEPLPDGPVRLVPDPAQRPELVKPAYRRWTADEGATGTAEVVQRWEVSAEAAIRAALQRTVLEAGWAEAELGWAPPATVHVTALRVRPGPDGGPPALSDEMLAARCNGLRDDLA